MKLLLKESVAKTLSEDQILKADFILKMLEDSSARDLKQTVDYDYLEIKLEEHEKDLKLGVQVCVHECDGALFVSAARKSIITKENMANWSKPWDDWNEVNQKIIA